MTALRKTVPSEAARKRLIGAVHFAAKKRGIDGDDYRDMLKAVTGKESCSALTLPEMGKVLDHLNGAARSRSASEVPQAGKIRALWISGYWLGVVNDRSDASLRAFVKRQTGIESERWLRDPAEARKVIEALKSWLTRVAGVDWGRPSDNPRTRVIAAQARRLADHGVRVNLEMRGFAVTGAAGLVWYEDRQLDALIVDLGRELRGHLGMEVGA
ncbi:MAG: DUF1018 domain-containing protein [Rhodospirillales bacterium]|nr:DUF1018 domain-containing protein [Rhodospirillales bacterium]